MSVDCRHVNPEQPILLAQRIVADTDARGLEILPISEGWYGAASPIGRESPAVVRALDRAVSADSTGGQRYASMGTDITQREWFTVPCAAEQDRFSKKDAPHHAARPEVTRLRGPVP